MQLNATQWIIFISLLLIYGIFLAYDVFKRMGEEKYGYYAYPIAIAPGNYLWYATVSNGDYSFGYAGSMSVLLILWILLVIRDIFIKDKEKGIKDSDDVALILVISVFINVIISAVLPAVKGLEFMQNGAHNFWKYFYMPDLSQGTPYSPSPNVALSYRVLTTLLVFMVLIPILIDLRGTRANIIALVVLTGIFMLPLWFVVYVWSPSIPAGTLAASLFLGAIVFFMILLGITRGKAEE